MHRHVNIEPLILLFVSHTKRINTKVSTQVHQIQMERLQKSQKVRTNENKIDKISCYLNIFTDICCRLARGFRSLKTITDFQEHTKSNKYANLAVIMLIIIVTMIIVATMIIIVTMTIMVIMTIMVTMVNVLISILTHIIECIGVDNRFD